MERFGDEGAMSADYILVVDDDASLRRLLVELLNDEGYRTRSAVDGIEALDQCGRELPRLMITDLEMPRLGGAELIAELEARGVEAFPVIIVSGHEERLAEARALADYCNSKPMNFERLLRQVRMLY